MLRIARNAPIVDPTTATQVLNDTCSAAGAIKLALPRRIDAARTSAGGVDMRRSAAQFTASALHAPVGAEPALGPVSMDASTDIPGRSRPSSGCWDSIRIFTGMRWTILVKFPVALSGGSKLNSSPLAGARLSTQPRKLLLGKVSTRTRTGSPARTRVSWGSLDRKRTP